MHGFSLSALAPQNWPFNLEFLPQSAFLVGGAVRDALIGRRREYLDLDFVLLEEAVITARKIASFYKAGFVLLDAERQIARVVFEQATADFAQAEGQSLATDLRRRDFTMNAIAYNPRTEELIDPLQGYADLQQSLIRMVSPQNLQDDPLRLLRAYRQAGQLNFVIESETRSIIRQLAPRLSQVAAERVQAELGYLLASPQGTFWLIAAGNDGLLQVWFPHTTSVGMIREAPLLAVIDRASVTLQETWPEFDNLLSSLVTTTKTTRLGIAKLASLLSPQPEVAEAELLHLKYSRVEIRAVTTVLKFLPKMQPIPMSLAEQYLLFQGVGEVFPTLAVLAVASGIPADAIAPLINRYLNPDDQVAHPTPLVTGNELMTALKLRSGPQVGQLLNALGLARAEGKISTAAEAIELASQLLDIQ